jgi:hypothetical protein
MDAPDLDALRTREYWEKRYDNEPAGHEFDWFKSYYDLEPWLNGILRLDDSILMLGCGNSVQTPTSLERLWLTYLRVYLLSFIRRASKISRTLISRRM